jgi:predicted transcriptional regulator
MRSCTDILISVHPCRTTNIINGSKRVELRRRAIRVPRGTRIWIYSTRPRACVDAFAIVDAVHELKPTELWRRFGQDASVSRQDFDDYFAGLEIGYALVLRNVIALQPTLPLELIRIKAGVFHPPQFFKRLSAGSVELAILKSAAPRLGLPDSIGTAGGRIRRERQSRTK